MSTTGTEVASSSGSTRPAPPTTHWRGRPPRPRLADARGASCTPHPSLPVGPWASTQSASCTAAVGFAFQAACQRGVPLVAVHAWTPDPPGDLEAVTGPSALAEALAGRILDRALDRWRSAFATVSVHTALVRGEPAHALIASPTGLPCS